MASFKYGDSPEDLVNYIYSIANAQIHFLQERYGAIAVKGVFDANTSDLFDKLQNNCLHLDTRALANLDTAAKLSIVKNQAQPQSSTSSSTQGYQPLGRGGQFQHRNTYSQDNYNTFSNKPFPQRPPSFQQQTQGIQTASENNP